jgi:hypothetical protein
MGMRFEGMGFEGTRLRAWGMRFEGMGFEGTRLRAWGMRFEGMGYAALDILRAISYVSDALDSTVQWYSVEYVTL